MGWVNRIRSKPSGWLKSPVAVKELNNQPFQSSIYPTKRPINQAINQPTIQPTKKYMWVNQSRQLHGQWIVSKCFQFSEYICALHKSHQFHNDVLDNHWDIHTSILRHHGDRSRHSCTDVSHMDYSLWCWKGNWMQQAMINSYIWITQEHDWICVHSQMLLHKCCCPLNIQLSGFNGKNDSMNVWHSACVREFLFSYYLDGITTKTPESCPVDPMNDMDRYALYKLR